MKLSILSFFVLSLVMFSSCQKGDYSKDDKLKESKDWGDKEDKDYTKCFALVYPVSYTMPDESTITMDNDNDWDEIKAWYENHSDSEAKPTLQYPIEIVWEEFDFIETIKNEVALIEAKKGCDDYYDNICEWDGSKVSESDVWEEYIVEPLETNDACDCIVGGVVKYVKAGTDFAYVIYYGKGECDGWGHLVTYYDGEDKKPKKCKFKTACNVE